MIHFESAKVGETGKKITSRSQVCISIPGRKPDTSGAEAHRGGCDLHVRRLERKVGWADWSPDRPIARVLWLHPCNNFIARPHSGRTSLRASARVLTLMALMHDRRERWVQRYRIVQDGFSNRKILPRRYLVWAMSRCLVLSPIQDKVKGTKPAYADVTCHSLS